MPFTGHRSECFGRPTSFISEPQGTVCGLLSKMSFGFSVGDVIALTKMTARTYHGWKNACSHYSDITAELRVLDGILKRVEEEVTSENALFMRNQEDIKQWRVISAEIECVVQDLNDILGKYTSLGSDQKRNWDRIRFGFREHEEVRQRLQHKTSALTAFLSVLGTIAQARVENTIFPELMKKMDDLAFQMRSGNGSVRSGLTNHEEDDKEIWRQFRRDLISSGFKSKEVHRYSPALKTYLGQLSRGGGLDEETPMTEHHE